MQHNLLAKRFTYTSRIKESKGEGKLGVYSSGKVVDAETESLAQVSISSQLSREYQLQLSNSTFFK